MNDGNQYNNFWFKYYSVQDGWWYGGGCVLSENAIRKIKAIVEAETHGCGKNMGGEADAEQQR